MFISFSVVSLWFFLLFIQLLIFAHVLPIIRIFYCSPTPAGYTAVRIFMFPSAVPPHRLILGRLGRGRGYLIRRRSLSFTGCIDFPTSLFINLFCHFALHLVILPFVCQHFGITFPTVDSVSICHRFAMDFIIVV